MTDQIKYFHVQGQRPTQCIENDDIIPIQPDDLIYNAPRPLWGYTGWQGDFVHGVWYAVVDPTNPEQAAYITRNNELDGWVLIYHSPAEIKAWCIEHFASEYPGIDLDEAGYTEQDYAEAFYNYHRH